jgi:hypothetical protein
MPPQGLDLLDFDNKNEVAFFKNVILVINIIWQHVVIV